MSGSFRTDANDFAITFAYPYFNLDPNDSTVWLAGTTGAWEIDSQHTLLTSSDRAKGLRILALRMPTNVVVTMHAELGIGHDGMVSQVILHSLYGAEIADSKKGVLKRVNRADQSRVSTSTPERPSEKLIYFPPETNDLEQRARLPADEDPQSKETYERAQFLNKNPKYPASNEPRMAGQPSTQAGFTNGIGMAFVRIAAGQFQMGTAKDQKDRGNDEVPHQVRLTKDFLLGTHEVTQVQYSSVSGSNPSRYSAAAYPEDGELASNRPVDSVSWLEAVAFCNRLSLKEGRAAFYRIEGEEVTPLGTNGYRLPTEAEWEYAAKAGTVSRFYWGNDIGNLLEHAWTMDNAGTQSIPATRWQDLFNSDRKQYIDLMASARLRTRPVGQKLANPWGLYDIQGNVWEWCWDRFSPSYYNESSANDPQGPTTGNERVMRGGGWGNWSGIGLTTCTFRPTYRDHRPPSTKLDAIGFRVACSP